MTDTVPSQRYELADRYRRDEGRVFMSGIQALARLPLEQLRADRLAGLDTAAFVCGYQGSPLAGYDREVASVGKLGVNDGYRFVAQPGLNEELAATALMGSQLASTIDGFQHDGVVGVWYGKAPGLDRAGDAIRHGVFAGASAKGGVVLLVGDDPAAKSSTLAELLRRHARRARHPGVQPRRRAGGARSRAPRHRALPRLGVVEQR